MKTIKKLLSISMLALLFFGCEKEESINPNVTTTTNINRVEDQNSFDFLSLTQDEYDYITTSLENDFNKNHLKSNTNIPDIENIELKGDPTLLSPNLVDYDQMILEQKAVVSKHSALSNFTSLLDIYHKALKLNGSELKNFVSRYENFLHVFEGIDLVMLKIPLYKAAILNSNGLIKVDKAIVQFNPTNVKVILDGDKNLIGSLSSTNKPTADIEVENFYSNTTQKSSRKFSTVPTVKAHPDQNLASFLQVGYIQYIDYRYKGIYDWKRGHFVNAGVEAVVLFQNQPFVPVSFSLTNYSTRISANCSVVNAVNGGGAYSSVSYNAFNWTSVDFHLSGSSTVGVNCHQLNPNDLGLNSIINPTFFNINYGGGISWGVWIGL